MIIFYSKKTGNIVGNANGRTHSPEELKMWIGNPEEVARIVIEWKPVAWEKQKINGKIHKVATKFEPDCDSFTGNIVKKVENSPQILHQKYKVDIVSKKLRKKTETEILSDKKVVDALKKEKEKDFKAREKMVKRVHDKSLPLEERFEDLIKLVKI